MGKLHLSDYAAHQRQLTLNQQMKTIASLTTELKSAESDYIAEKEELVEQKGRSQRLLQSLRIQKDTVATLDCDLKTREIATKMGELLSSNQQLMLPKDAPMYSITRRFRKLILLCQRDRGELRDCLSGYSRLTKFLQTQTAANYMI